MNAPAFYKPPKPPEAMPHAGAALAAYMASERAFKGIGPARAKELHKQFGEDLFTAITECRDGVIKVIGEANAIIAAAALQERAAEVAVLDTLDELGLSKALGPRKAIRVARAWGNTGVDALKDNPYSLLALVSWKDVDRSAKKLGCDPQDPRRVTAAIEHVLGKVLDDNDTLCLAEDARRRAEALLGFEVSDADIEACVASGGALRLADRLQPPGAGRMEVECAVILSELAQQRPQTDLDLPPVHGDDVERSIEDFEQGQPFRLTEAQRSAVKAAHTHRFFCLAGYAGSGKTTVLRAICDTVEVFGRDPLIMTLSGRAAQRAAEATGRQAITIAKFLSMNTGGDSEPLTAKQVVIVDEASMCSLPDIWRIVTRLGCAQLILCGDPAQLAPISFGLVFHVLTAAPSIPSVTLDRVMRQREDSGIPAVAEGVRSGSLTQLDPYAGQKPGVTFNECSEAEAIELITTIGRDLRMAPDDMQIIGAIKSGRAGVSAINSHFHQATIGRGAELWPGFRHIACGEPLIWTKNDPETGFTNGSMGRVTGFERSKVQAVIDGRDVELDPHVAGPFTELAYAITVHKAQGSQWPVVIIPVFANRLMDRAMIYTAITRAQEQVILLGDRAALDAAIATSPAAMTRKVGFPTWLDMAKKRMTT